MRGVGLASAFVVLWAGACLSQGLESSPVPKPRPDTGNAQTADPAADLTAGAGQTTSQTTTAVQTTTTANVPHPRPRPPGLVTAAAAATAPGLPDSSTLAASAPTAPPVRPKHRPKNLITVAASVAPAPDAPAKPSKKKATKKGSVCGIAEIKGSELPDIGSKTKGCGIDDPVKVTSISGVTLNPAATISCPTAEALKTWIEKGMRPAFGNKDVVELRIFGSYSCRTRNNKKGAKISEHGRGKALDIGAFVLATGEVWTIASNYNKIIRKAHKAACGIFGTTLGPGSDGYHEDHLHFDIAHYNNGSYCR